MTVGSHLLALALVLSDVLARGVRLRAPLRAFGSPLSLRRVVAVQLVGEAAGTVTPGRVGSDPARLLRLRGHGVPLEVAWSSFAVENGMEALLLLLVAAVLGVLPGQRLLAGALAAYAVGVLALWLGGLAAGRSLGSRPPGWWTRAGLRAARWGRARRTGRALRALGGLHRGLRGGAIPASLLRVATRAALLPVLLSTTPWDRPDLAVWSLLLCYPGAAAPVPGALGVVEAGVWLGAGSEAAFAPALLIWWRVYSSYGPALAGAGIALLTSRALRPGAAAARISRRRRRVTAVLG